MRAAILLIASFIAASAIRAQTQAQAQTQTQTWRLRESATTLKGTLHELLPRPGGDIITITHPEPGHKGPMIISRFDPQLNELYTRRIDLLSHEQYQAAWYAANHLFLFTTDRYGGLTRYELDDQSGGLTATPLPLTGLLGLEGKAKKPSYYAGHSVAGDYHYIAASTGSMIQGILLDPQGNKLTHFQYSTTTPPADPVFIQTGTGDLCIILRQSTLLHITTAGTCQAQPLTGLPNAKYLSWSANNETLYFSALKNASTNDAFTEILTGSVDPATGAVSALQHTAIATLLSPASQHASQSTPPDPQNLPPTRSTSRAS